MTWWWRRGADWIQDLLPPLLQERQKKKGEGETRKRRKRGSRWRTCRRSSRLSLSSPPFLFRCGWAEVLSLLLLSSSLHLPPPPGSPTTSPSSRWVEAPVVFSVSSDAPVLKLPLSAGQLCVSAADVAGAGPLWRHPLSRLDQMAAPAVGRRGRGPTLQSGLSEPVAWWAVHPWSTTMEQLQPQQESIGDCTHTHTPIICQENGGLTVDGCCFRRRRFITSGRWDWNQNSSPLTWLRAWASAPTDCSPTQVWTQVRGHVRAGDARLRMCS